MARFDREPVGKSPLFGLPVTYRPHDRTYLVGDYRITAQMWETLQSMTKRPYQNLTSSQLSDVLARQIKEGSATEATAFGDVNKSWLLGYKAQSSPYLSGSTKLWSEPIFDSKTNVETVFRVGSDGRPEAVTRLVATPRADSVRNAGETDLAWLKRRVNEICWSPS